MKTLLRFRRNLDESLILHCRADRAGVPNLRLLCVARVLAGCEIVAVAEGTSGGTFGGSILLVLLIVIFIAAEANGVSPAAVETLQFPSVDRQVFGFEVIVFADQRAVSSSLVLLAADLGRRLWFLHGIALLPSV